MCALDKMRTDYLTLCVGYSSTLRSPWKRSRRFQSHSTHLGKNGGGAAQFPGTPTMNIILSKQRIVLE